MSNLARFNRSVYQSQDPRRDVRRIVTHVINASHECPLLATGYCRLCPAYLAHRNGQFFLVTQNHILFNYELEHGRATIVANDMLSRHSQLNRQGLPTPQRTWLTHIHPPTESISHVCPPCTRPHTSEHTCPPCEQAHLADHVCPSPATIPATEIPEPETITTTTQSNPPIPAPVWSALQALLRRMPDAPAGTPNYMLRNAMSRENLSVDNLIRALRPITTTTVTTQSVAVTPSTQEPVTQPCTRDHLPEPSPSLPPMPPSVLTDPTVAQTTLSVIASTHSNTHPAESIYASIPSFQSVENARRSLRAHEINESPDEASRSLFRAIRWSFSMHRSSELSTLPHALPCMYHPCIASFFYEYCQRHSISGRQNVSHRHFAHSFVNEYGQHLQAHAYPALFVIQVTQPLIIRGRVPNLQEFLQLAVPPLPSRTGEADTVPPVILLPRLPRDTDETDGIIDRPLVRYPMRTAVFPLP